MTDIREKIASHVYKAMVWAYENKGDGPCPKWQDRGNSFAQDEARKAADAVLAALPDMVKPLMWEDHPAVDGPVLSMALVPGGGYFICDDTDDFSGYYLCFVSCDDVRWWQHVRSTSTTIQERFHDDDISPLKAAANTHHRAQVMRSLGIDQC